MHVGHRQLLAGLAGEAAAEKVVFLDERAPPPRRLVSRRRCIAAFRDAGVGSVVRIGRGDELPASRLAALGVRCLLTGAGEPLPAKLRRGGVVREVEAAVRDGTAITSARLRAAVTGGDLAAAAAMLGSAYAVDGRVVHGFHRGATIAVPTANLRVRDLELPPDGVYAVTVAAAAVTGVGVANLGRKPTFGDNERGLETHVFDFSGDLYGARVVVGFVERLRGERKFDDVDELVAQIGRDVAVARRIHQRDG